ncbi:MAG: gamma carbonic anhydrase family protein [Oscillospiraceae bacterium]|nr:gamma carbonic anhydrase family protein [Oscillospiraceae bacterium]
MAGAWIAPNATVVGEVTLQEDASVWYGAVLRGDCGEIVVGKGSNIQDNCVIHEKTTIGSYTTVGHGAIVHGCTIGDNCMVGMGAIVLTGAVIGDNCLIGAGAMVTGKMNAPAGSLILGSPAKVVKEVTPEQLEDIRRDAQLYIRLAREHM